MLVHVRAGKGRKDRTVPLPEVTLKLLRRYWRTYRHPTLLFPALGRGGKSGRAAAKATTSMNRVSVQGAFLRARKGQADAYRIINSVIGEVGHVGTR